MDERERIVHNLAEVRARIESACQRAKQQRIGNAEDGEPDPAHDARHCARQELCTNVRAQRRIQVL